MKTATKTHSKPVVKQSKVKNDEPFDDSDIDYSASGSDSDNREKIPKSKAKDMKTGNMGKNDSKGKNGSKGKGKNKNDEPEEGTPKFFEKAMLDTIGQFGVFVAAITKDLESHEQDEIREAEEHNDSVKSKSQKVKVPEPIWKDSTFKINFIQKMLLNFLKPSKLMQYYIVYVLPMKPWLTARDEKFFLENDHIYPNAPKDDIKFFKNLWSVEGSMTPEEKGTVWEYWDTLIEIAEDWQESTGWEPEKDPNFKYNKVVY